MGLTAEWAPQKVFRLGDGRDRKYAPTPSAFACEATPFARVSALQAELTATAWQARWRDVPRSTPDDLDELGRRALGRASSP